MVKIQISSFIIYIIFICSSPFSYAQIPFSEELIIQETLNYQLSSISTADLDNDGDMDILATSTFYASWYENDGSGSFERPKIIYENSNLIASHADDFDNDGDIDVLSVREDENIIYWHENDGNGTFEKRSRLYNYDEEVHSVCITDLDNDGYTDVISATESWNPVTERDEGTITWFENSLNENSGRSFIGRTIANRLTDDYRSVHAADLDKDADMDIIVSYYYQGKIIWYENDGNGVFGEEKVISTMAEKVRSVHTIDSDGDGDIDIFYVSDQYTGDDNIIWHENDGTGTFSEGKMIAVIKGGYGSFSVSDMDGDEDVDLLSTSKFDSTLVWYENDGSGTFGEQNKIMSFMDEARSVYTSDLNEDGQLDIITISDIDDKIAWYQSIGTLSYCGEKVIAASTYELKSVCATDLDNDGDADVLSASQRDNKIAWFRNAGDGDFSIQNIITMNADYACCVYASDLDGDGDKDVLSASSYDDKISWYENYGSGIFGEQIVITSLADGARSVFTSDLDGDGDEDILSASFSDNKIAWYENKGGGNLSEQKIIDQSADGATSVYASDLDGDGDVDVLSASFLDQRIAWYENEGNGSFNIKRTIASSAGNVSSVFAHDLDEDGDADVLYASGGDSYGEEGFIRCMKNNGSGSFNTGWNITSSVPGEIFVYISDLDDDGDMDVLSASSGDDKIAWYENDGYGLFGEQQVISTSAYGARSVFAYDLDGDQDMDVLSASYSAHHDDKIAWYRNQMAPVAYFEADTICGNAPFVTQFHDQSRGGRTGWLWGFGDGETSAEQNPVHTYMTAGSHTVSLTVTGPDGTDDCIREGYITVGEMTEVLPDEVQTPQEFILCQNYPNPFNPNTMIEYHVKEPCRVRMNIFNTLGQNIITLVDGYHDPGVYKIDFNAIELVSGFYFYQIEMGEYQHIKKMLKLD